ncbi:MAG: cysteine desulfurase family protein [Sphingobacteriales bacterium]
MYPIYLDYNATTPCDPRVVEAMLPYFTNDFGNAASKSHAYGWVAEEAVDFAREQVAKLIGAESAEIIFTSGSTEAINLAIRGCYEMYASNGGHIITTSIEHKAVLDTCAFLESIGAEVTYISPDESGRVDPASIESAIRSNTILISVMYANNETGVIMPIKQIGAVAKKHNVIFFCDATQAVGKIPVDVKHDDIDLLCLSAHKMYGPKGVGALYVRRKNPRIKLNPLQYGGGHEKGMRSGTLNVPGIVGLGKAAECCSIEMLDEMSRLEKLRNKLVKGLLKIENTNINGEYSFLLPQTINISFGGSDSEVLLTKFNKDIAISSGSACTSATLEPSYVLRAMGLSDERASSALRFSLGRFTTEAEIESTIKKMANWKFQLAN